MVLDPEQLLLKSSSSTADNNLHNNPSPHAVPTTTQQQRRAAQQQQKKKNAVTGASAASVRAVASQMIAFYFRAPVKAFLPARVDYLAFARAINPRIQAGESWSWRLSTPWLLSYAVREYGWGFIPNHVLPPMVANIGVGAVLYTSYLSILGSLHLPSSHSLKKTYPPPHIYNTFSAGFVAGIIQSAVAAPVDALQVRYRPRDMLDGKYTNALQYGVKKLAEIGFRGVFAGWELSLLKDSFGYGFFFATFEYVKAQAYYAFVKSYYGGLGLSPYRHGSILPPRTSTDNNNQEGTIVIIKPHYAIEPTFLMLAGISATVAQKLITYPVSLVQSIHHGSMARLLHFLALSDDNNTATTTTTTTSGTRTRPSPRQVHVQPPRHGFFLFKSYANTFRRCRVLAGRMGGSYRRWLWKGFLTNTIKQVPSTSAGLVIFELVRRRYGTETHPLTIEEYGYNILLT